MSTEPRFEISELVAQYVLHPEFSDFFLEGQRDRGFFEWFLKRRLPEVETHCYEISCVNVPSAVLKKYNLKERSEKNRVLALSLELAEKLGHTAKYVTCIADADFDYLLEATIHCKLLLYTDYTSLEMYTLTCDVLHKFLTVAVRRFPVAADRIIKEISPILVELFLVRATNMDLNLGMEWLEVKGKRYRVDTNGRVHFDIKKFVREYLEKNNMVSEEEKFWRRFEELKKRVKGDVRKFIRGHDYVELLGHYLYRVRRHLRQWKENPENLSGALLICLEANELCNESLFTSIVSRLS